MAACEDCGHPKRRHANERDECQFAGGSCPCVEYEGGGIHIPRRAGTTLLTAALVGGALTLSVPQSRQWVADQLGVDESQLPSREQFVSGANQVLGPDFVQGIPQPLQPLVRPPAPLTVPPAPPQPPQTAPEPPTAPVGPSRRSTRQPEPSPPAPTPVTGKQHPVHPAHPETPVKKGRKQ